MSKESDFTQLCNEARQLVGLTTADEAALREIAPVLIPALDQVTDRFYAILGAQARTAGFIVGRTESLRKTHRAWLESLFTSAIDADYARWMHDIGSVHVRVNLPVEFMSSAMAVVQRELTALVAGNDALEAGLRARACAAISSACGFCELLMQKSFAIDRSADELERYLRITGVSRPLYEKLSAAFRD